jgi:hypothetical protein
MNRPIILKLENYHGDYVFLSALPLDETLRLVPIKIDIFPCAGEWNANYDLRIHPP